MQMEESYFIHHVSLEKKCVWILFRDTAIRVCEMYNDVGAASITVINSYYVIVLVVHK